MARSTFSSRAIDATRDASCSTASTAPTGFSAGKTARQPSPQVLHHGATVLSDESRGLDVVPLDGPGDLDRIHARDRADEASKVDDDHDELALVKSH
jgi:hypothetical protein